jgi:hypothetical protein
MKKSVKKTVPKKVLASKTIPTRNSSRKKDNSKKVILKPTTIFDFQPKTKSVKTLHNTTSSQAKDNVKDIVFWGDGDTFKLISKASSKAEGWLKSTKAMYINNVGCVVQVTTQQGDNVAEAITFVPMVKIQDVKNDKDEVVSRRLVSMGFPNEIKGK